MTQFKLMSDLHLEFWPDLRKHKTYEPEKTPNDKDTVLLLAGDIHVGKKALSWIEDRIDQYKEVIYILGNHEFYHHDYKGILDFWQDIALKEDYVEKFTFLEKDWYYNDNEGYRIFGATMWTNVTDPYDVWAAKKRMADYNVILIKDRGVGKHRPIHVLETNQIHKDTIIELEKGLKKPYNGKTIVMTHHLPHEVCVHERFKNNPLNPYFTQNLDDIIYKYNIDVWCHGHTHCNVNTEIHGTKILCNPRGYFGTGLNQDYIENLMFEL